MENKHAKRVDIVSIKMVREGSTKYEKIYKVLVFAGQTSTKFTD